MNLIILIKALTKSLFNTDGANETTDASLRGYDGVNQFAFARKLKCIHFTVVSPNDLDDAIKKYEDEGKKEIDKPGVILFVEVGKYAKYVRKYDLAVETLESVFDYYDESNIALMNMAHVYEDMGEYQKAIDTYFRFYEMFPEENKYQFHVDIMHDYKTLGNKEKVVEYYTEYKEAGFKSEEIEQYISKL